jgi:hypothetical protein
VKVANWKKAVAQAARNRIFCHRAYIALPLSLALRLRREESIRHLGLGLLGVTNQHDVLLVRAARQRRPKVWTYYYLLAAMAARYGKFPG